MLLSYAAATVSSAAAATGGAGGRSGGSGLAARLELVNPIFQPQAGEVGEVAGVARDERESVSHRRAAYHQVKIINGAAHGAQAHFLRAIRFKAGTDQQNAARKKLLQKAQRVAVGGLPGRGAFGNAINLQCSTHSESSC